MQESLVACWSLLSESSELCRMLHPSAATLPSGTGNSSREPNLVSMGGDATSQLVFEPETVESLLPNEPGRCHAGGKKSRVRYRVGRTRRMREIRRSNTPL